MGMRKISASFPPWDGRPCHYGSKNKYQYGQTKD